MVDRIDRARYFHMTVEDSKQTQHYELGEE